MTGRKRKSAERTYPKLGGRVKQKFKDETAVMVDLVLAEDGKHEKCLLSSLRTRLHDETKPAVAFVNFKMAQ